MKAGLLSDWLTAWSTLDMDGWGISSSHCLLLSILFLIKDKDKYKDKYKEKYKEKYKDKDKDKYKDKDKDKDRNYDQHLTWIVGLFLQGPGHKTL